MGVDGHACGKYLVVMLGLWLPLLAEAGELRQAVRDRAGIGRAGGDECRDRGPVLEAGPEPMRIKGISTTKPSALLRNSISIRTCANETPDRPG